MTSPRLETILSGNLCCQYNQMSGIIVDILMNIEYNCMTLNLPQHCDHVVHSQFQQ